MRRESWLYASVLAGLTIISAVVVGLLACLVAIVAISLAVDNPLWVIPIVLVFAFVIATIGIHHSLSEEVET